MSSWASFVQKGYRTFCRQTFVSCHFHPRIFIPKIFCLRTFWPRYFHPQIILKVRLNIKFFLLFFVRFGQVNLDQINKPSIFIFNKKYKMLKICFENKIGEQSAGDKNYRGGEFLETKNLVPKFRDHNCWRLNVL